MTLLLLRFASTEIDQSDFYRTLQSEFVVAPFSQNQQQQSPMASTITTYGKTTRVTGVRFIKELNKGDCKKKSGKEWRKQQTAKRMATRKIEEREDAIAKAQRLVSYLEKVDSDKDAFFESMKSEIDLVKEHYKRNYDAWNNVHGAGATAGGTSAASGTAASGGNASAGGASEWTPLEVKTHVGRKIVVELSDLHFLYYLKSLDKRFENSSTLFHMGVLERRAVELGLIREEDAMSESSGE
ncbi:expressed unknown protein [Seminavis robusta]|uniref:Uncharacterized protein n=1 Tax=Seminavis robusta TaxID=568900 RepID=A0A9N8DST3_9STRA|nr:expressed unknown protein [Seminavis robusta]|eukprot:Sro328_g118760.1 n/a (241) ;mRNA; f:71334-72140